MADETQREMPTAWELYNGSTPCSEPRETTLTEWEQAEQARLYAIANLHEAPASIH